MGQHLVSHLCASGDDVMISTAEITDPHALAVDFERGRPEVVFHLAAQADVAASFADPAATLRTNAEGTLRVLEAACEVGVARVVVVSSADVYGNVDPCHLPVAESAPLRPITPYGASKAAAEMVCLQAAAAYGLGVVRARAFNHLGPGQSDRFVAAAIAARIATNERCTGEVIRVGNLEARRDFTDVRDVVRAYRLLARLGEPGEAYNVCSGFSIAVGDLAERLVAGAHHRMRLEIDEKLLRPVEVAEMRGDPSKLVEATGWHPQIPLSTTVSDLLDYWRNYLRTTQAAGVATVPAGR